MTTAREIMTPHADHLKTDTTIEEAAQELARADVGAMPYFSNWFASRHSPS